MNLCINARDAIEEAMEAEPVTLMETKEYEIRIQTKSVMLDNNFHMDKRTSGRVNMSC